MRATIRVPATVANLGPGFDILAMALQLQNEVVAETREGEDVEVVVGGSVAADDSLRDAATNLVARAYTTACTELGIRASARGVRLHCHNEIPIGRGLGSSAAAALSGVLAATAVHRAPWDEQRILGVVTGIEGHPDNAAAALLGGAVICAPGAAVQRFDVPDEIHALLFVPAAAVPTTAARRVVAASFSRDDALFNAARCALLVRALMTRDYAALREAMEDRWHQEQRAVLFPAAPALVAAAYSGGAAGACLAGAGPSILALTAVDPAAVAGALRNTAADLGVAGEVLHLRPRNFGARVDVHA